MVEDLNKNSILLIVRLSKPGNRRKVPSGMVQVDADESAVLVSKELLDCPEMAAIATLDGEIRRWIYLRCLPSGVLKEGVYRLPLVLVDEVNGKLESFAEERNFKIEQFLDVYPQKVIEAHNRLRSLYDPSDYPPVPQLRKAFDFQYRYVTMDIPQNLSNALVEQEREKAKKDVEAEVDEIRLALRTAFADLVSHATNALTIGTDNKPKVFRDTLVTNMQQFFNYFDARNLTNDTELAELVEQARCIMQGVTPDTLRTNMSVRQQVQQTMKQVKSTISASVMLKPSRRFTLDPV